MAEVEICSALSFSMRQNMCWNAAALWGRCACTSMSQALQFCG